MRVTTNRMGCRCVRFSRSGQVVVDSIGITFSFVHFVFFVSVMCFLYFYFSYFIVFLSVVIYRGDMPSGNGDAVSGGSSCNKEVPNVIASTATGVHNASKNYP